jgi:transposase-like protein
MTLSKRLYEAQVKKDEKTVKDWNRQLAEEIKQKEKGAE